MPVSAFPPREKPTPSLRATISPLLPLVALGDEGAVKECFHRYRRLIYSLAWRFSNDQRDVEDACQDIFLALWKNAGAFDPARGSEATFVALIARRRLIDRSRLPATRPLPELEEAPPASGSSIETYVDARNAMAALSECSDDQRRVISLSAFQGLSHEEISHELSIPLGTVKSHYARGIERLKRALKMNESKPR